MPKRLLPTIVGMSLAASGACGGAAEQSPYAINGLAPGTRARLEPGYRCWASRQFANFTWCQRRQQERTSRGNFVSVSSLLQDPTGVAAYINRDIEPAFFSGNDIQHEIARLAARFAARALVMRLPRRDGLPSAIIASWGQLELELLGENTSLALAKEGSAGDEFHVDYLGDPRRSAELGLPVFRLSGGAGYLWSATSGENGRGHLRFLAVDAALLAAGTAAKEGSRPFAVAGATASIPPKPMVERRPAAATGPEAIGADRAGAPVAIEAERNAPNAPDRLEAEAPAADPRHRSGSIINGALIVFAFMAAGAWLLATGLQRRRAHPDRDQILALPDIRQHMSRETPAPDLIRSENRFSDQYMRNLRSETATQA
jgi:hypothetical protein